MPDPILGNQAAPATVKRGSADWREDLLAYDRLPEDLRQAIQDAPFEADAAGVLAAYRLNLRRFGSPLMAMAATAGDFARFMERAREAARYESATRNPGAPEGGSA